MVVRRNDAGTQSEVVFENRMVPRMCEAHPCQDEPSDARGTSYLISAPDSKVGGEICRGCTIWHPRLFEIPPGGLCSISVGGYCETALT